MYYPDDKDFAIFNAKLTDTLSCASEFEFNIPMQNQMYDVLEERISMIQILRDTEEVFYGEVREIKETLEKVKTVYCVGELAFLFDSTQPQARYQNIKPVQMFTEMLNIHNSKVEEKKRFYPGIVTIRDSNDSLYRYTNGEDTLTAIRKKLCEPLGGYLRIRKVDGKRYLDLIPLEEYGVSAEQPIQFGRNLLKYNSKRSGANIATVCVPRGAKLDTQVVEGLDAYVDIKSVNDGKDYVINEEAYATYGWIEKVVEWNDVTTSENLLKKAQEWVNNNQYRVLSLDLKAVDLAELNANLSPYKVGDMIQAIAEPFGMNMWFPLMKKVTYINDSITNDVTLSYESKMTYTSRQNNNLQDIGNAIPQNTIILELAKENASQIIKNATEGNIFFVNDDNGVPKELLIMDTPDINTAQKIWRFNLNGLGYSSTGYNGTYGLAFTMDGAIVADFITVGTLNSVKINNGGGKFKVDEYGNAVANSFSSSNATITGGSLKIKKNSFDYDVLVLESDENTINFKSTAMEIFDKNSNIFSSINCYGLSLGTFTGTPHTPGTSMTYNGSYYNDSAKIVGNLTVSGTKSRLADTEDYNERLLYCYETSSPLFGDIGEGQIDDTGKCCVFLDDVFAETIDIDCAYQVFLQPYGDGQCYITERNAAFFVVEGTENLSFGWELKAIQKNFDTIRLEQYEKAEKEKDVLTETSSYLETFLYDIESEVA